MKKRSLISFLAIATLFASQPLSAKKVYLWSVPHHVQESNVNCGIATARMWIAYRNHHRNVPGEKKVYYSSLHPYLRNGINAKDMERILEKYTGHGFQYHNISGKRRANKYIYDEIRKQHRPIAIAAATRYNGHRDNGVNRNKTKPGQHWLLMWAADARGKHSGYKPRWVLLHDPLFWSKYQYRFHAVNHRIRVYRKELYNTQWLKIPALGKRQLVED